MIKLLDVCFVVHGIEFYAHKCILTPRSEYFEDALVGKWEQKSIVHINHKDVNPNAFRAILNYLYTESTKPGTHMTTVLVESPPDSCELQMDLAVLAEEALPIKLRHWLAGPELLGYKSRDWYGDVIFLVEDNQLLCHKAFFCTRSEYFRTLLRDSLGEMDEDLPESAHHSIPFVPLREFGVSVFLYILYYIYQESVEMLRNPDLHELILEDAAQVNQREDVDYIDVIDNVRYHLTAQSFDEAQDKLHLINQYCLKS